MVRRNLAEIYFFHQVCRLLGCVDVNSRVLTWPLHGILWAVIMGRNYYELA